MGAEIGADREERPTETVIVVWSDGENDLISRVESAKFADKVGFEEGDGLG